MFVWGKNKEKLNEEINKNLCGRDGRTICGPQWVPKSTSVTLAVDEKTLPRATITGRTDRRTDRVRRNMRPPPGEEGRIIIVNRSRNRRLSISLLLINSQSVRIRSTACFCVFLSLSCGSLLRIKQETQLSLTHRRDAFIGHSWSLKVVPINRFGVVSY